MGLGDSMIEREREEDDESWLRYLTARRQISNETVEDWLKSWGPPEETECPGLWLEGKGEIATFAVVSSHDEDQSCLVWR